MSNTTEDYLEFKNTGTLAFSMLLDDDDVTTLDGWRVDISLVTVDGTIVQTYSTNGASPEIIIQQPGTDKVAVLKDIDINDIEAQTLRADILWTPPDHATEGRYPTESFMIKIIEGVTEWPT